MKPFLRLVAEDLYAKFGDDLSRITVVFPNNRARLFFGEYLADIAGKPIWSPKYTTIQDLFAGCTDLRIPDTLNLVCDLFTVYNENVPTPETFDEFYFWGEILLSDFDDVDKNRVDATALFRNIKEQGEFIDTFEHLSEEQKSYLRMFFKNFSSDMRTELKERFLKLWDALIFVYQAFQTKLKSQGLAYEGMMNRMVVDRLRKEGLTEFVSDKYAFVGFNVLNECENELFSLLDNAGKALFYWDYDVFYTDKPYHEAGTFINRNRLRFHNELPKNVFDNFEEQKKNRKFTFISSSTENAQARYLNSYLTEVKRAGKYKDADTAVVLCNEGLLLPVLHSVPECVSDINVTMGFPLTQTPVYSLVVNLLDTQMSVSVGGREARYRYVVLAPLLRHSYIRAAMPEADALLDSLAKDKIFYPTMTDLCRTERLSLLFRKISSPLQLTQWLLDVLKCVAVYHKKEDDIQKDSMPQETEVLYDDLYKEALFRTYTQLSRLDALQKEEQLEVSLPVLARLIKRLLSSISVPFSGEPVRGMQIMGFLETRNLDFKNVVLLSVNEGVLPNSGKESSFIPYNLRKGYGMTTIEHKNSLYAYYFYRLLQRAENVTLLYNSATEGLSRGQMSRFMLQLLAETDSDVRTFDIRSDVPIAEPHEIVVEKTDAIVDSLKQKYDVRCDDKAYFSPSALNAFVDCSLRFYFRYVKGLKVKEDLTEEVDPSMFGTLFHKSAELLYTKLGAGGRMIQKETLDELASKGSRPRLEAYVDAAFRSDYFGIKDAKTKVPDYTGEQLINRKVITDFLTKLVRLDAQYAPFSIQGLEHPVYERMSIPVGEEELLINIGGIVDRMDLKEGIFRIVDYKTGGNAKVDTIENIFEQKDERAKYLLQAFLYSAIKHRELQGKYEVKPAILYVNKAIDGYSPDVSVLDQDGKKQQVDAISKYEEEYRSLLEYHIGRIFDKKEPFRQTSIVGACQYCDYREICRKRN